MEIYHGGYCPIEHPEIIKGIYAKDFGTGFYCTGLREQAVRWAKRYDTSIMKAPATCMPPMRKETFFR
ncbi:MAG: DUF3990 domain-containing protein [Tannerellaceae bacterium]|jgi:hypothetical protein|nr:DUF3990 domain-containing protein [Tannerellaceae bacterium]